MDEDALRDALRDAQRAFNATCALIDGRRLGRDHAEILRTLEYLVAVVLLSTMGNDHRKARTMLRRAIVPGVEMRLDFFAKNTGSDGGNIH